MSIAAIDAAWGIDVSPPARKLVLLCMANRHNGITGQLNPSVDDVARSCGISPDQARRHLHSLIESGLLEVIGNHHGGRPGMSRNYRLNLAMTTGTDATPSMGATPGTDAAEGLHPCSTPLAPMQLTPCIHASQTGKNLNEPEINRKVTRADHAAAVDDSFARFWDAYPKKVGKQAAEKAFSKVKCPAETLALILKALAWQCESDQWLRDGGQYIPNPATYINQGRWDDEQPNESATPRHLPARTSRHSGFEKINYREGINDDGSFS